MAILGMHTTAVISRGDDMYAKVMGTNDDILYYAASRTVGTVLYDKINQVGLTHHVRIFLVHQQSQ